jgi:2-C-methyl-D-erythritol 4-phosphate cytidylyltransferase
MMVTCALGTLLESRDVDRVWIVAAEEWRDAIREDAKRVGLPMDKLAGFAEPGVNRQDSVRNGLKAIKEALETGAASTPGEDTVLVHDAARPLLSQELLHRCYRALPGHDGVMPVLPMKDTVYFSEDGKQVTELLDRQKIYAGQAPELFLFDKYYDANMTLSSEKILTINGASEPAILAGMDIAMIPGDEDNFKVTTQADLDRYRNRKGEL